MEKNQVEFISFLKILFNMKLVSWWKEKNLEFFIRLKSLRRI